MPWKASSLFFWNFPLILIMTSLHCKHQAVVSIPMAKQLCGLPCAWANCYRLTSLSFSLYFRYQTWKIEKLPFSKSISCLIKIKKSPLTALLSVSVILIYTKNQAFPSLPTYYISSWGKFWIVIPRQ